jgi:dipeptidyl aminopeptidase/acylaminoacyl peptidase
MSPLKLALPTLAFAAAAFCLPVQSVFAQAPAKHGMTLDDFPKLLRIGAPQLSPDGKWVAYTLTHTDIADDKSVTNLWMVSYYGSQDIQLTYGKESAGSPRWSPDGRFLAFTSGREGEAKGSQVWVLDRRGGEAHQLTNVKESLDDYRWSPDSKTLLLTLTQKDEPDADEKGGKPKSPKPIVLDRYHFKQDVQGYLTEKEPHLYLFEIASKKLSKVTTNPVSGVAAYQEEGAEFSPDGKLIAFVSNQSQPDPDRVANPDIFVVSATPNSTPRRLTTFTGTDSGPLTWTANSASILFHQGLTPHYSIYDERRLAIVPAAGGETRLLAPDLDQWVGGAQLIHEGKAVLTTVSDDRQDYVAEIPLEAKHPEARRVTKESGSANALNAEGGHVVLLWTTDATAPEIYALEGEHLRKLTTHNDALVATLNLAPTEDLSAKASDGSEVHSLLTLPVGFTPGTKVPMLLRIHGGPTAQDAHGFNPERQLFAAHGYAVLNVNYRGSTGRGHAYSEAINADWGDKEVLDLLAATDAAIATGNIDANQLGVGGWSYGGILTDYTIASTTRFKGASSGAGMGNLLGFYGIDQYILQYENELGPPWKNLDAYIKLSYPFLHADRIKTPTLFMGGDKDFNVPLEGGEQMYQALKSVNTPAELIVYPGQFHGFSRPSFNIDRYQRWFAWYDHYVRNLGPATPPAPTPTPASAAPAPASTTPPIK